MSAPSLSTEVSAVGGYPSTRFGQRERKLLESVKSYVDTLSAITGTIQIDGTLVTYKDNATSFRLKGPQHASEGGADVQTYAGMFYNDSYDTVGTLKTRASYGANTEMDLALQSPHALLLIAQDGSESDGIIKACSQNAVEIHTQYSAEELSPKRLVIDRASTATKGSANTSDVVVKANSGSLLLNAGVTDGAVVLPTLSTAERDALTPIAGMVIYNSTSGALEGYDGAWKALA